MKTLRSLLVLMFAAVLAGSVAFAAHHEEKKTPDKPADKAAKAACGCATGEDGKVCGVDKDCCCTGEKATGKTGDKKPEEKKPEDKKTA